MTITVADLQQRMKEVAELARAVTLAAVEIEETRDFDQFVTDVWEVLRLYEGEGKHKDARARW